MLSPEQIRKRALNCYEDFLRWLVAVENKFPLSLFGGGLSRITDYTTARDAIIALREHSKQTKGFGYSVEWKEQTFRRFGEQQVPATVSFSMREDYTRFVGKCSEVRQFEHECKLVLEVFPELAEWILQNPLKIVEHAGDWTGLLAVCAYLVQHGRPNCYLRELPVEVDTKFIERKRGVLGEILPIVAPACVGADESTFEARFGFEHLIQGLSGRLNCRLLTSPFRLMKPAESASPPRTSSSWRTKRHSSPYRLSPPPSRSLERAMRSPCFGRWTG